MVAEKGLEPLKPASLVQYLCQFGYSAIMVLATGFEPVLYGF